MSAARRPTTLPERAMDAIQRTDAAILKRCLDDGLDPNAWVSSAIMELPILMHAADVGSMDCVKALLDAGADPRRAVTSAGGSALRGAVVRGNLEMARLLLEAGDDASRRDSFFSHSYAHLAAQNRQAHLMDLLHTHGCPMDAVDKDGRTPLHHAYSSQEACMELLRLVPHTVNARCNSSMTPLMEVAEGGTAQAACVLLAHGADVEMTRQAPRAPGDPIEDGPTPARLENCVEIALRWNNQEVHEVLRTHLAALNAQRAILGLRGLRGQDLTP